MKWTKWLVPNVLGGSTIKLYLVVTYCVFLVYYQSAQVAPSVTSESDQDGMYVGDSVGTGFSMGVVRFIELLCIHVLRYKFCDIYAYIQFA